ncbi:MAG: SIR2 family protein [Desulfobulbus sp.]|nr:SIR2 family protein [Desulfobulbus sp.]
MKNDINSIKQALQRHLSSGLVVIIGSGLSCAEGLPSMQDLAQHLSTVDPSDAGINLTDNFWCDLVKSMNKDGIESALHQNTIDEPLADFIRKETAQYIIDPETKIIQQTLAGAKRLKLSHLFPHLPSNDRLPIITTNYDRLVELAAEMSGYQVDTKAFGFYHAPFSETNNRFAFCSNIVPTKPRGFRKIETKCISLYKPHGSLDWTQVDGKPIRTAFRVEPDSALIITPGQNKYRAGYDSPFDMQRELANKCINNAAKFLIIGYGFNDNHLEVHLKNKIMSGTPTVLMAHSLTDNARIYQGSNNSMISLEHDPCCPSGTLIHINGSTVSLPNQRIWDVEEFAKEVMGG